MSREFDGSDDQVQWTVGGTAFPTGAYTFASVIELDTGVTWQSFLGLDHTTDGSEIAMGRHGGSGLIASYAGGGGNTQTAVAISSADGWMLIAARRAAGIASISTHTKYPFGGAATHTAVSGGIGDPRATVRAVFGNVDNADFFDGRMFCSAIFPTVLSNGDVESLVTTFTRANWDAKGAMFLVDSLDSFATDHSGNGATRTTLTGTSSSVDDPPGADGWATAEPGGDGFVLVDGLWVETDRVARVGGEWV
jgi:hypothetical protein